MRDVDNFRRLYFLGFVLSTIFRYYVLEVKGKRKM